MGEYALRARQLLREAGPIAGMQWKQAYRAVLEEAYRARDIEGLTRVAMLGAVALEAAGLVAEAIQQLDYAAAVAEGEPTVASRTSSQKAVYLALGGDRVGADAELSRAADLSTRSGSTEAASYADASAVIVGCITFAGTDSAEIVRRVSRIDRLGFEALGSTIKAWLIPYLFARGERDSARPWIDALGAQADAARNLPRAADAHTFRVADRLASRDLKGAGALPRPAYNPNARWRARLLLLRALVYRTRLGSRAEALAAAFERPNATFKENSVGGNPFCALIDALEGREVSGVEPPGSVTLVNLPAVLCALEAVAIGGTQASAGSWLRWSSEMMPAEIVTSLEWPVLLSRIRGLLEVRSGSFASATASLRSAVRWGSDHQYDAETAIARLQLAEVLSLGDVENRRASEIRKLRIASSEVLARHSLSPIPHAYAAARAVGLRRLDTATPRLSPRQTEVLRLLSAGLTYREIAGRMDISWRTVQFMVSQIYGKLDVHRKIEAVEKGRELQII